MPAMRTGFEDPSAGMDMHIAARVCGTGTNGLG